MALDIKIKVVGVGGSGCNAIARMSKVGFPKVELVSINTDAQDLKKKAADLKLRIGKKLTQGLGTGMNPGLGRRAAEEQREEIGQVLKGADIVFITTGLGGGTGSGASPLVAQISKELGALTIGVVTLPFSFEGLARAQIAKRAERRLREKTDTLIVVPNDNLFGFLDPRISFSHAFEVCDEILNQAVKSIADLVLRPGIINLNFADIRSVMKDSGTAFFGAGKAKGEARASEAAKAALSSPLLGVSISRARGILFNISGGPDIGLHEIDEAAKVITEHASPETKVIFGAVYDEKLKKEEIKVTLIATGF
jgi:cell division protein FtsZ